MRWSVIGIEIHKPGAKSSGLFCCARAQQLPLCARLPVKAIVLGCFPVSSVPRGRAFLVCNRMRTIALHSVACCRSAAGLLNQPLSRNADRPVTTPALVFPSPRSHAWANGEDRRVVGPTNFAEARSMWQEDVMFSCRLLNASYYNRVLPTS